MADDERLWHRTACILCENNCGVRVHLEGRHFAKIRGDADHPASAGYTCNKALRLDHYQNGGSRLTSPLRREPDGRFTEVDWDTATREIADRLRAVTGRSGGESLLVYGGGGQGNHLGGAYLSSLMAAVGARHRSNALAQEKTGEAWVDAHLTGGHTVGDFENAQVAVFIGKNPWQSHGVPRARTVLQQIARDPDRTMIVVDPVRTETADLADIHLQVRPGTDAWCLAAILGVLVQEGLCDDTFLAEHTTGAQDVRSLFSGIDVTAYALACGVEESLLRTVARRIGSASSVSTYEDLGVQQGLHSTLVSYLEKLLWLLTGNFARRGAMNPHSMLAPLARYTVDPDRSPVTGAAMHGGLVPCSVLPEEILTDHPRRFRAMVVDSSNPAHSLADTQRWTEALRALELLVVVDVAMTETARLAHYVLPAASQYEKWEATFFTLEFPRNVFHLRAPLLPPLDDSLPEPEIYARILRRLHPVPTWELLLLRAAARLGRRPYAAVLGALFAVDRRSALMAAFVLHETLGPALPEGARSTAVLWGLARQLAARHGAAVRRAGHHDAEALFDAMLTQRSGTVITLDRPQDAWRYVRRTGRRIPLVVPDLLCALERLADGPIPHTDEEYPYVLSAGQRRSFTANTIFRTDAWRTRDTQGALRISPDDARDLRVGDGEQVVVSTRRGRARAVVELSDRMQPGHVALPNGFGLDLPGEDGRTRRTGAALNELTDLRRRDEFAGTPWHKHVPARIERADRDGARDGADVADVSHGVDGASTGGG